MTPAGVPVTHAAAHFQEVAFVFDNTQGLGYATNPFGAANTTTHTAFVALARTMSNAWVNFFVGLDPNGGAAAWEEGGIGWPVYNATEGGGVGRNIVFAAEGSYTEWDDFRAEGIQWMIDNSLALFGN